MTFPEPEVLAASCARATANVILHVPQYVLYFTIVLVATRAAYPSYDWRTSLRDSAIGFVIFAVAGRIEQEARRRLGLWTTHHERRAVAWVANAVHGNRLRDASGRLGRRT